MPKVAYSDHELFIDIAKETNVRMRADLAAYKLAREMQDSCLCNSQLHKFTSDMHDACVVSRYFARTVANSLAWGKYGR